MGRQIRRKRFFLSFYLRLSIFPSFFLTFQSYCLSFFFFGLSVTLSLISLSLLSFKIFFCSLIRYLFHSSILLSLFQLIFFNYSFLISSFFFLIILGISFTSAATIFLSVYFSFFLCQKYNLKKFATDIQKIQTLINFHSCVGHFLTKTILYGYYVSHWLTYLWTGTNYNNNIVMQEMGCLKISKQKQNICLLC